MAGKKKSPLWRKVFLRALARTGNARASAVEAGIDVGTAYDHRIKDPAFARQWAAGVAKFKANAKKKALRLRSGQALRLRRSTGLATGSGQAGKAGELVLRRTKHGDKLVRAAPGRWCARVEETFFDTLELTGCVRSAAAAAGISTAALYERRKNYPEFAERWDEVEARASQQLPVLLHTAAVASLGPDPSTRSGQAPRRGRGRLPRVNVDQAIRISRIKAPGAQSGTGTSGPGGRGIRPRVATNAEVREALTKALAAFRGRVRARHVAEGWTETEDGHLVPPGCVYVGTQEDGEGAGDAARAEDGDSHE